MKASRWITSVFRDLWIPTPIVMIGFGIDAVLAFFNLISQTLKVEGFPKYSCWHFARSLPKRATVQTYVSNHNDAQEAWTLSAKPRSNNQKVTGCRIIRLPKAGNPGRHKHLCLSPRKMLINSSFVCYVKYIDLLCCTRTLLFLCMFILNEKRLTFAFRVSPSVLTFSSFTRTRQHIRLWI